MKSWIKPLVKMHACSDAVEWCDQYDNLEAAWQVCERGDWMLWLLGRLSGPPKSESRKKLVLTACQCARLALIYVAKGEERPLRAIETAEAWANDDPDITLQDVRGAADAGARAADAAADAADAAYAAAYAADAAAYAADAADAAADAADAADAARMATLKECADIVRAAYDSPKLG